MLLPERLDNPSNKNRDDEEIKSTHLEAREIETAILKSKTVSKASKDFNQAGF
jgi:hypothetical protein